MGFLSEVGDIVFGESPELETRRMPLLNEEQQRLLNEFLVPFLESQPLEDVGTDNLSELEQQITDIFTQRAQDIAAGGTGDEALARLIDRGGTPAGRDFEDFFTQVVEEPTRESFEEETLPALRRQFTGQFSGSEFRQAANRAVEDLTDTLGRERSRLAFQTSESDADRFLRALGLESERERGDLSQLAAMFEAGGVGPTREFEQRSRRIQEILGALSPQEQENIAVAKPGRRGLLSAFVEGLGKGVAAKGGG